LEKLLPYIVGNIGFIFTNDDLSGIAKVVEENKVEASAKVGALAPCDVFVEAGSTGMEPTKTSFFQALNISTKIAKGQIDISVDVHLIKKGTKVGNSEATLLQMLAMKPFRYGLTLENIYENGAIYDPSILKITTEDILNSFQRGITTVATLSLGAGYPSAASVPHFVNGGFKRAVKNIAAISLEIHYPSAPAIPHFIQNGYKRLLSIALETPYSFPRADQFKGFLANPTTATTTTTTAAPEKEKGSKKGGAPEKKKPEPEPEPPAEEEDDVGMGGLFG